jgi:hypothetical protein
MFLGWAFSKESHEGFGKMSSERNMVTDTIPVTTLLEQKRANTRKAQAIAAAGMLGVATLFGATACKDPTNPTPESKKCDCPESTIHDAGDPCCEGVNCTCETIPEFSDIFYYTYNGTHADDKVVLRSQFEDAYAALDAGYVVGLKGKSININFRNNGGANQDRFNVNMDQRIRVYGNPVISPEIFKATIDAYILLYSALNKQFGDAKNVVRIAYAANKYQRIM